jgi:hypothetical protein
MLWRSLLLLRPVTLAILAALGAAVGQAVGAPQVLVTRSPQLVVQLALPSEPRKTTAFTLTNVGDAATFVMLSRSADFFTQSPDHFTLQAGGSQTVIITAAYKPYALDPYEGYSIPSGAGVPPGLKVAVQILFRPLGLIIGDNDIIPERPRVEVAAPAGSDPSGSLPLRNSGGANRAFVASDSPWLVAQSIIDAPENGTATLPFRIVRASRPDAPSPSGSVIGSISLNWQTESGMKGGYKSSATVIDTVKPVSAPATIPVLPPDEIALFVPGVGNVTGSGQKVFLSDVSAINPSIGAYANEIRLYYRSAAGSSFLHTISAIAPQRGIILADIVKSVFGQNEQVGVLQIRGRRAETLGINASVFNVSNSAGTYGTAIPVFRSDRSLAQNETIVIPGIRRDDSSHTNLYLQETSGLATTADIEFLAANGSVIGPRTAEAVGAFAVRTLNDVAPAGAVTARIRNSGAGRLTAYATPVDDASGDTWALVDWNRQFGMSGSEPMVIPVAGAVAGARLTYFRTDVAIANAGTAATTAALRYYRQNGEPVSHSVPLTLGQTATFGDVVTSAFKLTPPSLGFIIVTPAAGARLSISSRTYTTVQGEKATFGTGVPTLPATAGLVAGESKLFGAVDDTTRAAVQAGAPGTFRTNFGLVETGGGTAVVRVHARFFNGTPLTTVVGGGWRDFPLKPYELVLATGFLNTILGEARETTFGDLHDIQARFEVLSGTGRVVPFITTTDNGTGDTLLRID